MRYTNIFPPFVHLKGQSHEKVGKLEEWGVGLGPN
jgi:hypothetical protein